MSGDGPGGPREGTGREPRGQSSPPPTISGLQCAPASSNGSAEQIDLPAWLIAQGFHLSATQREPTRLALCDRHGETLYLRKDVERRTWTYFTERGPVERGTVVDLMLRRDAIGLDECLNRMAACLDPSNRAREPAAYREALADRDNTLRRAVARHLIAVTNERDAERDLERLGVVRGTFDSWRFGPATGVLGDPDDLGHSRYRKGDRAMVFVERPIDAIAYERTHGKQFATYVYTGDNPSDEAKRKIAHVLADAPPELTVVAAFRRDRRGIAPGRGDRGAGCPPPRRAEDAAVRKPLGRRNANRAAAPRLAPASPWPPQSGHRRRPSRDLQGARRWRRPRRHPHRHRPAPATRPGRTRSLTLTRNRKTTRSKEFNMLFHRYAALLVLVALSGCPLKNSDPELGRRRRRRGGRRGRGREPRRLRGDPQAPGARRGGRGSRQAPRRGVRHERRVRLRLL